jgi:hypothetical protein
MVIRDSNVIDRSSFLNNLVFPTITNSIIANGIVEKTIILGGMELV